MSSIDLKAVVFDTDSLIKTSVSSDSSKETILERVLKIKGKYYIHEQIQKEVHWPEKTINLLVKLISENKIVSLSDKDLLNILIKDYYMPYRSFLTHLKKCCEIFDVDYYERYYFSLEEFLGKDINIDSFISKINNIEQQLLQECKSNKKPSNLGEIKTALVAAIFNITEKEKINYFISDDKRARNSIVLNYTTLYNDIRTISVIGIFLVLMKDGVCLEDAKNYIKAVNQSKFKVFDSKNNTVSLDGHDIINLIYSNEAKLLKNGVLQCNL